MALNFKSVYFLLIIIGSVWSHLSLAQDLEVKSYGAYGLFPQGSSRAMGMGGAYTGLSDDIAGLIYNPAGLGLGKWKVDVGGTHNQIENREYEIEINNSNVGFGLPYSFVFYGAAFRLGSWVIGAAINTPYNLELAEQTFSVFKQTLKLSSMSAVITKSFGNFSLGVAGHQENVEMSYIDELNAINESAEAKGSYYTVGCAFQKGKLRLGASYSPRREYDIDESLNDSLNNSIIYFRDVKVPAKTSIGLSYALKESVLVVVDIDRYEKLEDTILPGTGTSGIFLDAEIIEKEQQVLHGGVEWHLSKSSSNDVIWRLGGYKEPSRFEGAEDRMHFTMGLEVRFGPAILSVSVDTARNFRNTSSGFSVSFGKI